MQRLAEDAADNIGAAACRVWHDEPDRPRRERFRPANGSRQNYRRTAEQRKEGAPFHCPMPPVLPTERIADRDHAAENFFQGGSPKQATPLPHQQPPPHHQKSFYGKFPGMAPG